MFFCILRRQLKGDLYNGKFKRLIYLSSKMSSNLHSKYQFASKTQCSNRGNLSVSIFMVKPARFCLFFISLFGDGVGFKTCTILAILCSLSGCYSHSYILVTYWKRKQYYNQKLSRPISVTKIYNQKV